MSELRYFFCDACKVFCFKNQCYHCKKTGLQTSECNFMKISFRDQPDSTIKINIEEGTSIFENVE